MLVTILLEDNKTKNVSELAEKIHDTLAGNQDYVDSNIVLNFENGPDTPQVTVFFSKDDCCSPELIREKAKGVIDLFLAEFQD